MGIDIGEERAYSGNKDEREETTGRSHDIVYFRRTGQVIDGKTKEGSRSEEESVEF